MAIFGEMSAVASSVSAMTAALALRAALAAGYAGLLAAATAQAATAASPPLGSYECTIGSGNFLFGTLVIKAGGRYTKDDTKGTFTAGTGSVRFKDGITGTTIRFKGGSLNGISGRWYRAKGAGVTHEIALKNPEDGFESIYCDRQG